MLSLKLTSCLQTRNPNMSYLILSGFNFVKQYINLRLKLYYSNQGAFYEHNMKLQFQHCVTNWKFSWFGQSTKLSFKQFADQKYCSYEFSVHLTLYLAFLCTYLTLCKHYHWYSHRFHSLIFVFCANTKGIFSSKSIPQL